MSSNNTKAPDQLNGDTTRPHSPTQPNDNQVTLGAELEAVNSDHETDAEVAFFISNSCAEVTVPENASKTDKIDPTSPFGAGTAVANAVVAVKDLLWDAFPQTIKYAFIPGDFEGTEEQQSKFAAVAEEWTYYANVSFKQVDKVKDAAVRITFNPDSGSWSYIGNDCMSLKNPKKDRDGNWLPTLNFSEIDRTSSKPTRADKATILHEVGHVLGLLHEHQSPGIDALPTGAALQKVYHAFEKHRWSPEQVDQQVLNIFKKGDVSNFSSVDRSSIMHYPLPKVVTGLDYDMKRADKLSDVDKAYMVINYPRQKPHAEARDWTLAKALDVAQVPDDVKEDILRLAEGNRDEDGEIDAQAIRERFTEWAQYERQHQTKKKASRSQAAVSHGKGFTMPGNSSDSAPKKEVPQRKTHIDYGKGFNSSAAMDGTLGKDVEDAGAGKSTKKGFIDTLYDKLNENFGPKGGNQYLALQFPTRYLDKRAYAYGVDGIYSQFNKPPIVNEAEFKLTDELFPIGRVVGGPNGKSLSTTYELVLNNLVPKSSDVAARKQREKIRKWLLRPTDAANAHYIAEEVIADKSKTVDKDLSGNGGSLFKSLIKRAGTKDTTIDGASDTARPMTRIEFSDALTQKYMDEKAAFETNREKLINEARRTQDQVKLEELTRELIHTDLSHRAKLASTYADSVVRGYSHVVRECLGTIDIKSTAENLQDAKDSLRESAVSSLLGASKVYPVQMKPVDWFEALDTSFTPADLAADPSIVAQVIQTKAQHLDDLRNELDLLTFGTEDVERYKKAVEDAVSKRDAAQASLTQAYSSKVLEAYKIYATLPISALKTQLNPFKDNPAQLTKIETDMKALTNTTDSLNAANRALAQALAGEARSKAQDTAIERKFIQRQIATVTKELADLQAQMAVASLHGRAPDLPQEQIISNAPENESAEDKKAREERNQKILDARTKLPKMDTVSQPGKQSGSRWIDISLESEVQETFTERSTSDKATTDKFECNLWLGSVSTSSENAASKVHTKVASKMVKVGINMRCTMVTVDRSSWFRPEFFDASESFSKNSKLLTWTNLYKGSRASHKDVIAEIVEGTAADSDSVLPAFPVSYIIVKDMQVRVRSSDTSTENDKSHVADKSAASGGILCFSYSVGSVGSSDSSTAASKQASDGIVVNIPGPQILGYIMQLMPPDKSTIFDPLKTEEMYSPPEEDEFVALETSKKSTGPARGFNMNFDFDVDGEEDEGSEEDEDERGTDESDEEEATRATKPESSAPAMRTFKLRPGLGQQSPAPTGPAVAQKAEAQKSRNPSASGPAHAAPSSLNWSAKGKSKDKDDIAKSVMQLLSDTEALASMLDSEPEKKAALLKALQGLK